MKVAVFTLSTDLYLEKEEGSTALAVKDLLQDEGHTVIAGTLPEDINIVRTVLTKLTASNSVDLVITVGSTGLKSSDMAPAIIDEMCDMEIPGIAESLRYTVADVDRSVILERGKAGICDNIIVVNLCDKEKVAVEGLGFVLPEIVKASKSING